MDGNTDRVFQWVTLAVAAGIAAGAAAAVTSAAFPYAFGAAFTVLRSKRKKDQREHRHRSKAEKVKRTTSKPKEGQTYRAAIRRALLSWKDIDVTFEKFPYFVNENTKSALLDSMYVYLKRPEFTKYTADLTSVSPRILLTGPPGSEIYQEHLVKGLARQLQVNLLVFDSARVSLEASESVPGSLERVAESSSATSQRSTDASVELPLDASPNDIKDLDSNDCRSASSDGKAETLKTMRSTSLVGHSKDADIDSTKLLPLSQLRSKSKGEATVDVNSLVTVVAAAATTASTSTTVDSRRLLKKGDRVKYVGTPIGGASGGVVVLNHGGPTGGPAIGARGRVLVMFEENPNKAGVRFDKPVYGGNNLVDLCEDGHGFFCNGYFRILHMGSNVEDRSKPDTGKLQFKDFEFQNLVCANASSKEW